MKKNISLKVLEMPYFNHSYLNLLNSNLEKQQVKVSLLKYPLSESLWFFYITYYWLKGYRLIHMHWIPFYREITLKLFLQYLKFLNIQLVWTLHNYLPHEPQFKDDKKILQLILDNADQVIIHSEETKRLVSKITDSKKLNVIHCGTLNNYYLNTLSKKESRKNLGLPLNKKVILFFGHIRPYKGIEDFIACLEKLDSRFIGLIAGNCTNQNTVSYLKDKQKQLEGRLFIDLRYIPDNNLQTYFNSSDYYILPYRDITTSAAIFLGYAFKIPVIFRYNKNIKSYLINKKTGFFYKTTSHLIKIINYLEEHEKEAKHIGQEGYLFSKKFDWNIIAKKLLRFIKKH